MKILAIESSCDDCAVAIIEDGTKVRANVLASQEKIHAAYGGVVPEVASREHLRTIYPLVEKALKQAKMKPEELDALAVTAGPGLLGSLIIGINAAKTLAWLWNKPLIPINHLQAHVYAAFLDRKEDVKFPIIGLVASGGHTEIVKIGRHGEYKYLGGTVDDAVGEAFDKVARFLGLGYPGGPAIAKEALKANTKKLQLPRPMMKEGLEFSYSGLKTAATRVKDKPEEIAWAFQESATDVLVEKLYLAAKTYKAKTVIIGGGASANVRLREKLVERMKDQSAELIIPEFKYCTDNAAMIGAAAYYVGLLKKSQWYNTRVMESA